MNFLLRGVKGISWSLMEMPRESMPYSSKEEVRHGPSG